MNCDEAMYVIPLEGMNYPADVLASQMQVDHEFVSCSSSQDSQDIFEVQGTTKGVANGLVHIRHSQHITHFILADPSRMIGLPWNAPPPKLHYSTWWRSVTKRIYRANASSVMRIHAPVSKN